MSFQNIFVLRNKRDTIEKENKAFHHSVQFSPMKLVKRLNLIGRTFFTTDA